MRKNYKALGLDIDGTLTNSEKIITPETKEAVIKLQQEGIHVIIASGRSEYGVRHLADELKFDKFIYNEQIADPDLSWAASVRIRISNK